MYRYFLSTILLAVLLVLGGCGGSDRAISPPPGPEGQVSIRIQFPTNPTRGTPTIAEVWVKVTAADMDDLTRQLNYDPNTGIASGTITIPAGRSRTFYVWAEDSNGDTIYDGSATADVPAGETTQVDLDLRRTTGDVVINGHVLPWGLIGTLAFDSTRETFPYAQIFVVNFDGSGLARLTYGLESAWSPKWFPDGTRIAFVADTAGESTREIYVMNADGTNRVRLTNNSAVDEGPDWSSDGSKIAFCSKRDGNSEIYVMNADGSGQTNLTRHSSSDFAPSWSPDGTRIVFTSKRDGGEGIYIMDSNGQNVQRLPGQGGYPDWSPDGSKIAFVSSRDGNNEIYTMNPDGSGQTNLTHHPAEDQGTIAWTPDGSMILFFSNREGPWRIYTMNVDGTGQAPLTVTGPGDGNPDVKP